jgi:hypothetical protein
MFSSSKLHSTSSGRTGMRKIMWILAARARPCAARSRLFGFITHAKRGAQLFRSFLFDPQKYLQPIELGQPTSRAFFLSTYRLWNRRSPAPAPPIAASLILPSIFLGSNYVFFILTVCCITDMHINDLPASFRLVSVKAKVDSAYTQYKLKSIPLILSIS